MGTPPGAVFPAIESAIEWKANGRAGRKTAMAVLRPLLFAQIGPEFHVKHIAIV